MRYYILHSYYQLMWWGLMNTTSNSVIRKMQTNSCIPRGGLQERESWFMVWRSRILHSKPSFKGNFLNWHSSGVNYHNLFLKLVNRSLVCLWSPLDDHSMEHVQLSFSLVFLLLRGLKGLLLTVFFKEKIWIKTEKWKLHAWWCYL